MSTSILASNFRPKWVGMAPCLIVLAATSVVFILIAIFANFGKAMEDERAFVPDYRDQNVDELIIEFTMDYILNSAEYNDVLFHGDSTCRYGVNAKLFEDQSKLKAFNIGTMAWIGWSGYCLLFEKYLEHHPRPKMIVLCIHPSMLPEIGYKSFYYEERLVWCYGSGAEGTRPKHANPLRDYTRDGLLAVFGYATHGRVDNRTRPLKSKQLSGGLTADELIEQWTDGRGSTPMSGFWEEGPSPETLDDFFVAPNANQQLRKMAQTAKNNNILFVVQLMPVWKDAGVLPFDRSVFYEKLRGFEDEFDNLVVVTPHDLEYDKKFFHDASHLNEHGSTKITEVLVERVTRILEQKRRGF